MFSSAPWITLLVIGSMRSGLVAGWRAAAVLMLVLPGAHPSRRRYAPPQGEVSLVGSVPPHPEERPAGPRLEGWQREGARCSLAGLLADDEVARGVGFEAVLRRDHG